MLDLSTLPRVIHGLDDATYHGHKESLSQSGAKRLLDTCPAKFKYELDHPEARKEPTKAMELGSLAHMFLLEGEAKVADKYVCLPEDHDGRTKRGKELLLIIEAEGKRACTYDDYQTSLGMFRAMQAEPIYALFDTGWPEVAMFWREPDYGITLRAKLDWLPEAAFLSQAWRNVVPDYKTCLSAHPDELRKGMWNFGYYIQARLYMDGLIACGLREDPRFMFVAQEKTRPYLVTVYEPDDEALAKGREKMMEALDLYRTCLDTGKWPAYAVDVVKMGLPGWVRSRIRS